MNKEVQDKVFQYIDAMADKLGVAVERVYEVMYKQMIVEGIISAVTAVISILIITVGTKYFLKLMNYLREKAEDTYEDRWSVLIVISWIIYLILLVISIISLYIDIPMTIGKLANPEYYLMKDIMEMVKK